MAISKIREIRGTLDKAIRYICNPDKTEDMLLISSYRCVPETAAAEMTATYNKGRRLGNRLAYHLIQSFSPEDKLTSAQALELGKKYAALITDKKYEYVIATHVDKGHIHNHIIFNAVSFEKPHRKYHHGQEQINALRTLNDKLCSAYGLTVTEKTSGRKGKNFEEYQKSKSGNSWRDRLADMIDEAIFSSDSFEAFLEKMELEGVTVRLGKHISFRCELLGQERAARGKSIGNGYTEEAIRARIARDEAYLSDKHLKSPEELRETKPKKEEIKKKTISDRLKKDEKIHLLVETHELAKARQSRAYANAVQKNNITNLVKSMNFLEAHGLESSDDLASFESGLKSIVDNKETVLKNLKEERSALHEQIKFAQDYKKNVHTYITWRRGGSDVKFHHEHAEAILAYQVAKIYFDKKGIVPKELNLKKMFETSRRLKAEIEELYADVKSQKALLKETTIVRKNYEKALGVKLQEEEKDKDELREKNEEHGKKQDERS